MRESCSDMADGHLGAERFLFTSESIGEGHPVGSTKVVSGRWSESPSVIRSLKWPALQQERRQFQLSVCNRILSGHSLIPSVVFQAHPRLSRVHANSKQRGSRQLSMASVFSMGLCLSGTPCLTGL